MIKTHLLTPNGFAFLESSLDTSINFKAKDKYTFYGDVFELATGLQLIYPKGFNLKGIKSSVNSITNSLDSCSDFQVGDYLYTPFEIEQPKSEESNFTIQTLEEDCFNSYLKLYRSSENTTPTKLETKFKTIILNEDFYKFICISLVRSKVDTSLEDCNLLAYKFSKSKPIHLSMKKDLLDFLNKNDLNYEVSEYNKYYYINFIDKDLSDIVLNFQENSSKKFFLKKHYKFFIEYLYGITNNNYYLNQITFLFLKELAYNSGLVISLKKNTNNSNHKYSFVSNLVSKEESLDPDVVYTESGYLTKILSKESINIKDDTLNNIHLPKHLIIC